MGNKNEFDIKEFLKEKSKYGYDKYGYFIGQMKPNRNDLKGLCRESQNKVYELIFNIPFLLDIYAIGWDSFELKSSKKWQENKDKYLEESQGGNWEFKPRTDIPEIACKGNKERFLYTKYFEREANGNTDFSLTDRGYNKKSESIALRCIHEMSSKQSFILTWNKDARVAIGKTKDQNNCQYLTLDKIKHLWHSEKSKKCKAWLRGWLQNNNKFDDIKDWFLTHSSSEKLSLDGFWKNFTDIEEKDSYFYFVMVLSRFSYAIGVDWCVDLDNLKLKLNCPGAVRGMLINTQQTIRRACNFNKNKKDQNRGAMKLIGLAYSRWRNNSTNKNDRIKLKRGDNWPTALSPDDLENLVYLYILGPDGINSSDYVLYPSYCKMSEQKYEFKLCYEGERPVSDKNQSNDITCQVKNQSAIPDLDGYFEDIDDGSFGKIFLFSGIDKYWFNDAVSNKKDVLSRKELLAAEKNNNKSYIYNPEKTDKKNIAQENKGQIIIVDMDDLFEFLANLDDDKCFLKRELNEWYDINNMNISKSKYCDFCRCHKMAWLGIYKPDTKTVSESLQSRFAAGHEAGELAKSLFGDFVDVTTYKDDGSLDITAMIDKTQQFVQDKTNVICEAAFSHKGKYCAVDLLKNENGGWAIYEVKSSTHADNPTYFTDVAYQKYTLEQCGINVVGTYLVCLNSDYIRKGNLDIKKLFKINDISTEIIEDYKKIEKNLTEANEVLTDKKEPNLKIGQQCNYPYRCVFFDYCTKDKPSPSVFNLYRFGFNKACDAYNAGITSYESAINSVKLNDKQYRQVDHYLNNKKPYINKAGIREFLDKLTYPLYFLDYETMQPVIPQYDNSSPYQQITFQYSLHYIPEEGGELKHTGFLAESGPDPRRAIAEHLCKDIPKDVCIMAYNNSFEISRTKELAEIYPDLAEHLLNIANNIVDLLDPFRDGYYYQKEIGGSFSIKSVLPAMFPDDPELNYHNLEGVQNGGDAMEIFPKIKDMSPAESEKARINLWEYCKLDTYAMVKIWQKFIELTK